MTILNSYSDFRYAFSQSKVIGNDGYEVYPSNLVRANGFDDGFTNLPTRAPTVPFSFPLVFYIAGNVAGPPAFRAYLSQRRESSSPLFTLIEDPASIGGWEISISAAGIAEFGNIVGPFGQDPIDSQAKLDTVCKYLHFYIQRPSDFAIQWIDIWSALQVGA
jgi:hypothetical protein